MNHHPTERHHPYHHSLKIFNCKSFQEVYSILECIAKNKMGLDRVPFPLSALENPPGNVNSPNIESFIVQCMKANNNDNSDAQAIKLIKFLKENPPKESFENPKFSDSKPTQNELYLMQHIFSFGIDLPGSRHNPFGHLQYFSSFFIDMFFGNYTEFNNHVKSLSKKDLKKAMKKREGYCQYSPIFAPILGMKLAQIDAHLVTSEEEQKIKTMYNLKNENKHYQILLKLIKLGADVNAHDINGFTPLHFAVCVFHREMCKALLRHGANPNPENRDNRKVPLFYLSYFLRNESAMRIIDILIQYNANLRLKNDNYKDRTRKRINEFRSNVEAHGSLDLAVRVRESHPRDKEECEKCMKPAVKKCSACSLVYYCTPACQKLDWKFHKVTCQKNKIQFQD